MRELNNDLNSQETEGGVLPPLYLMNGLKKVVFSTGPREFGSPCRASPAALRLNMILLGGETCTSCYGRLGFAARHDSGQFTDWVLIIASIVGCVQKPMICSPALYCFHGGDETLGISRWPSKSLAKRPETLSVDLEFPCMARHL